MNEIIISLENRDQEFFCGQGSWTRTSSANRFAIGFHSDSSNPTSSQPYRFQCTITVVEKVQPSCNCGQSNSGVSQISTILIKIVEMCNLKSNTCINIRQMSRIVGGSNSAIGEFPWRVSLYSVKLGVFCGGTIISNNFVLTAVILGLLKEYVMQYVFDKILIFPGTLYQFSGTWRHNLCKCWRLRPEQFDGYAEPTYSRGLCGPKYDVQRPNTGFRHIAFATSNPTCLQL